ncbi:hypothetical protein DL95DRAFT_524341 [Leptodontidium sp. 2 PMI_412]|nr:hypothetical protein DL95DRAFT_524341 [Leptodontidium sp. 2 PMI_412]
MPNRRREHQSRRRNSVANSSRTYVYQYRQDGQISSEPRSFGEIGSLAQNIRTSDGASQDSTQDSPSIDPYVSSQTSGPIGNLSQNVASSSLSDTYTTTYQHFTYSPRNSGGEVAHSSDPQGSRPIAIGRNTSGYEPNPRATEFQHMIRGSSYLTSSGYQIQESSPGYNQPPPDQDKEYPRDQNTAGAEDDYQVSSSMETVVPTDWRRMAGKASTETSHTSMLQFARINAPSPIQSGSYNIPSRPRGISQQSVPAVQHIAPEGSQSAPQNPNSNSGGGSRDNTPQPGNNIHKNIPTLQPRQSKETLNPEFQVHDSSFFKPGQVFKVLWAEPEGNTASSSATAVTDYTLQTKFDGENVYTSIRRFIIVAADKGHCQCLPILTYKYYATLKNGVKADDHAIVYMDDPVPDPLPGESLSLKPIKLKAKSPRHKLKPQSRINYAKIYTVEHNVKVLFIGEVSKSSRRTFMTDFDQVWANKRKMTY